MTIYVFIWEKQTIQTSQTEGQWYSDTSPFSIPWLDTQRVLSYLRSQILDKDGSVLQGQTHSYNPLA